jgi:hypothetical protein
MLIYLLKMLQKALLLATTALLRGVLNVAVQKTMSTKKLMKMKKLKIPIAEIGRRLHQPAINVISTTLGKILAKKFLILQRSRRGAAARIRTCGKKEAQMPIHRRAHP